MRYLVMLVAFGLCMCGVRAFATWGIHTFGPGPFGIVVFPLVFLVAYLCNRRWGGGASFW